MKERLAGSLLLFVFNAREKLGFIPLIFSFILGGVNFHKNLVDDK